MRRYLILMPILMLAACGGKITKPNTSQAQMNKDTAACNYEAAKATAGAATSDYGSAFREADIFKQCMYQLGYVDMK